MGIFEQFSKLYKKFQNSNTAEYTIFDENRKLIDLPTILNCSIADLCDEEKLAKFINDLAAMSQNLNANITSINNTLSQEIDDNSKKQYEAQLKNLQQMKKAYMKGEYILGSKQLLKAYLTTYKNRLNPNTFTNESGIIDLLAFFELPKDFTLAELNQKREEKENVAYTLNASEKNSLIDQINHYYEVLSDPIRKKGYFDILQNPQIPTMLDEKIKELSEEKLEKMPVAENNQPEMQTMQPETPNINQGSPEIQPMNPVIQEPQITPQSVNLVTGNANPQVAPQNRNPINTSVPIEPQNIISSTNVESQPKPENIINFVKPEEQINQMPPQNTENVLRPALEPIQKELDFIPVGNVKVNRIVHNASVQRYHSIQNTKPTDHIGPEAVTMLNKENETELLKRQLNKLLEYKQKMEEQIIPSLKEINEKLKQYEQNKDNTQIYALTLISKETLIKYAEKQLMNNPQYVAVRQKISEITTTLNSLKGADIINLNDPDGTMSKAVK